MGTKVKRSAAEMRDCWIFGNGEIKDISLCLVPEGAYIIAADGGLKHILALGLAPDLILGDFDSFDGEFPEGSEIMKVPAEKDDTDMLLAVKTALSRGYRDITLCGALGGRLDHTLANIQTLEYISVNGGCGRIFSGDNEVFIQRSGSKSYGRREGWYFSLFALSDEAVITSSGTKYDLTEHTLRRSFPLGVSNEITSDEAEVNVMSGKLLVVFSKK